MLCEYGCNKSAKFQLKNGKWCCSKFYNSCPGSKNIPWNKGKKGLQVAWNKGQTEIYSENTIERISKAKKGKPGFWKNKIRSKDTIKKIKENHINVKGKNNPNWKGGYSNNNIPIYDNFFNKLTIEENPKRDNKDQNILTVCCTNCGKRFIPKLTSVYERVRSLNGKQNGENRLYCSDECKQSCSIFNKHTIYNSSQIKISNYTNEEYNIWRQEVLKRADFKCEYCGESAEHVHHSRPQKLEPFFSLDPDFGIACCSKCHYKYGHINECSTGQLANKICS